MQALPGQVTPAGLPNFKLVLVGDGGTGTHQCTFMRLNSASSASSFL